MTRLRFAVAPFLLVTLVALGGCGSDDDTASKQSDSDAKPPASEASSPPTDVKPREEAAASIEEVVTAIESCATGNVNGTYTNETDCLDPDVLSEQDPSVVALVNGTEIKPDGPASSNGEDGYFGYSLTLSGEIDGGELSFTETHTSEGEIERTCSPEGAHGCGDDGTW
jgi:hypothetical protein